MTPLEIVKFEMENQVGLYDGVNKESGTGFVISHSFNEERIFCGFSGIHKLPFESSRETKETSRLEWEECAKAVISKLALEEYCYGISTLYYNGFSIEEL